jgi:hypothetical protein
LKPLRLVVVIPLLLLCSPRQRVVIGQATELTAVLNRAAEYVARYEDSELGNLLVAETYLQTAVTYNYQGRGASRTDRRRTQSDFLMLAIDQDHVGLRMVNTVDGEAVDKKQKNFETVLGDSSLGVRERISAVNLESSRYNIGAVNREINVPTFALKVMRKKEAVRFSFTKRGEKKVNGVNTWEIKFQEQRAPTLSHGLRGESLLSFGSMWIEPGSGRIVKTEWHVENPYSEPKVEATITVTYKENKALGILVPSDMQELYTSQLTTVTCVANYSNYRSFNVDVKSVIDSKPPAQ